jgi:hypothetical protein
MSSARTIGANFAADVAPQGTPEPWLAERGLTNALGEVQESGDSDRDGLTAWMEFVAGTDPTNAVSFLAITNLFRAGGSGFVLSWPSVSNRIYGLDRSTNLASTGFGAIATNLPATPPLNVHTDALPGIGGAFYRVRVRSE